MSFLLRITSRVGRWIGSFFDAGADVVVVVKEVVVEVAKAGNTIRMSVAVTQSCGEKIKNSISHIKA